MLYQVRLLSLLFCFINAVNCKEIKVNESFTTSEMTATPTVEIIYHSYPPMNIPDFFTTLTNNHFDNIYRTGSSQYLEFCQNNELNAEHLANKEKYMTILFLHELFTANSASDCSKGTILNIPYFWHWITLNPRHDIAFVETGQKLTQSKPPSHSAKYKSYADVDRKPFFFLSDMVHGTQKYYTAACDTFATFGWCSEREMAFVALTILMGYEGKVISQGNHSWTELLIPMKKTNGNIQKFVVSVDNTFNGLKWEAKTNAELSGWKTRLGDISMAKWYNDQAHSSAELTAIRNHQVSPTGMERIEAKVAKYFNSRN